MLMKSLQVGLLRADEQLVKALTIGLNLDYSSSNPPIFPISGDLNWRLSCKSMAARQQAMPTKSSMSLSASSRLKMLATRCVLLFQLWGIPPMNFQIQLIKFQLTLRVENQICSLPQVNVSQWLCYRWQLMTQVLAHYRLPVLRLGLLLMRCTVMLVLLKLPLIVLLKL